MGELRDNSKAMGVWARVFGGADTSAMINDANVKNKYITTQVGFDGAIASAMGWNNYLGFAISYGFNSAKLKSSQSLLGAKLGFDSTTNNIELGIYNSYITDEGIYSDTIAKFSYIMTDYSIVDTLSSTTSANHAISLGEQLGYRYNFDINLQNRIYLDPQIELIGSYLSPTSFTQSKSVNSLTTKISESFMLRSRAGLNFGYKFTKFAKFSVTLRAGASYIYDLVSGATINLSIDTNAKKSSLSINHNDGRLAANAGLNLEFKKGARLYFDFEKSFFGKLNTDYLVNLGLRYSFGRNAKYLPKMPESSYKSLEQQAPQAR